MTLPKSIFFILNPEGKAFHDSVSHDRQICKTEFVKSWGFVSWGIHPTPYESDVIFKMFERAGFKLVEIPMPTEIKDSGLAVSKTERV